MDNSETLTLPSSVMQYIEEAKREIPGLKVVPKEKSSLMKFIAGFFSVTRISPRFMTEYFTTIGTTIYVPSGLLTISEPRLLEVIIHEVQHSRDFLANPFLFVFTYLFPQILAVLSLLSVLSVFNINFAWFLLFLLFAAPLPAYWRYQLELKAYRISLLFAKHVYGYTTKEDLAIIHRWIIAQLATKYYYFTWPFPSLIKKDLENEEALKTTEYDKIVKFLTDNFNRE